MVSLAEKAVINQMLCLFAQYSGQPDLKNIIYYCPRFGNIISICLRILYVNIICHIREIR